MEILCLRWGGLGDLLVTLPSIQLLRRLYPQAKITLVANPEFGELLRAAGLVDVLISSEDKRTASLFQFRPKENEAWLGHFDRVVAWLNKPKVDWVEIMGKKIGRKFLALAAEDNLQSTLSEYFFKVTAKSFSSDTRNSGIRNEFSYEQKAFLPVKIEWQWEAEKLFSWVKGLFSVVIHPGSGGRRKRWDLGNFMEIINRFSREGISGVVIIGPAEQDYHSALSRFPWPPGWGWRSGPSLRAVAWLLSKSAMYIGNDSGVTQLAGFCGCPGVALFLEENVRLWSPCGKLKVLKANSVNEIEIDAVWEEIKKILGGLRAIT